MNYADSTGLMGERVGGDGPGDPKKRSFVRRTWDWFSGLFRGKPQNRVIVGMATSSVEPDLPTISQAPYKRMPSTIGAAIQDYRDSGPISGYGTAGGMNIASKVVIDQILDFGNFTRNSFLDRSDYSGLGSRMTKWDGNTMSATESQDAKFNALLTADVLVTAGVSTLGSAPATEAGSINYMKSTDNFARFAARAAPQEGALDVIGHGGPNIFQVNNITVNN